MHTQMFLELVTWRLRGSILPALFHNKKTSCDWPQGVSIAQLLFIGYREFLLYNYCVNIIAKVMINIASCISRTRLLQSFLDQSGSVN